MRRKEAIRKQQAKFIEENGVICLDNVSKSYSTGSPALNGISLKVHKGEFVFIVGDSGSGKSTLIKLLLRELVASSGQVSVMGKDMAKLRRREIPKLRRNLGVVFQDFRLIPGQTVYQNVELARRIVGSTRKENRRVITSLFVLLGISHLHNRYPEELSGGEKQKVCLARALVNYPAVLLADEPTGNLSPAESRELFRLFELVHRQGITVIVATHDREGAAGLAYREIALGDAGAEA